VVFTNNFNVGDCMERAIWKGKEYYAINIANLNNDDEQVFRNLSGKELYCPDPMCQSPLLKYCHGDIKKAYFSHLNNSHCDYAKFDKDTTPLIKTIKDLLYNHLLSLGYTPNLDEKIGKCYMHVTLQTGDKKLAFEIGTQNTLMKRIESVEENCSGNDVVVKWIVISQNNAHDHESEVSCLKRHCLNNSINNDLLIVDEEGEYVTQYKFDTTDYSLTKVDAAMYGELFFHNGLFEQLVIENDDLTLKGFNERFDSWYKNKQEYINKKIQERKREEELAKEAKRRAEEYAKRQAELQEQKRLEREQAQQKARQSTLIEDDGELPKELAEWFKPQIDERKSTTTKSKIAEKERQISYDQELKIKRILRTSSSPYYDAEGCRWLLCKACGRAKPLPYFAPYTIKNNLAVCLTCLKS
jgi:hypothetical protein